MKKWLWVGLVILLAACGSGKSNTAAPKEPAKPPTVVLGDISMTVTENRFPFLLRNGSQRYQDAKTVMVRVWEGDQPAIWEGQAEQFHDMEGPYYVVFPAITHAGLWNFDFEIDTTDGSQFSTNQVVNVLETPLGLTVGDAAIPSDSVTATGLDKLYGVITTDSTPNLAFYEMTVAQAVESGRPSIIVFATPELCTRSLCGPVLDSLDPIYERFKDQFNFVHVETYNLETGKKVPAVVDWGLEENPWFYLVDANGVITYRCEGIFSAEELTPVIEKMLADGV